MHIISQWPAGCTWLYTYLIAASRQCHYLIFAADNHPATSASHTLNWHNGFNVTATSALAELFSGSSAATVSQVQVDIACSTPPVHLDSRSSSSECVDCDQSGSHRITAFSSRSSYVSLKVSTRQSRHSEHLKRRLIGETLAGGRR